MKINWNGHSSFTIVAADGTTIVTDPYEPGAFGGGISYHPIDAEPDIVTISHDHDDHNYTAGFKGDFVEVRDSGEFKGIKFEGFDSFHDENRGRDRGDNKILIFTVDDIRICHMGDLGHNLNDAEMEALGEVDILLVPIGGFYTIDFNVATDIIERLRPKITIPMHFKTEKCGFPIAEIEAFTEEKENVQFIDTDAIELEADKLPGMPEIKVLKHRL